jgi:hypothetical protein
MSFKTNYLWHDLIRDGGIIIISPYEKYNGGLSPRDVLTMTQVLSALCRHYPQSPFFARHFSHFQPQDWDNHLILIGGLLSNQITKAMTSNKSLRGIMGSFSLRKEMLLDSTRLPGRNCLTPTYQKGLEYQVRGAQVDYGIISIQPNPMNITKKIFLLAGIKGWGGLACASVFSKHEHYKLLNSVIEQSFHLTAEQLNECKLIEIIVKAQIGHTGTQGTNDIREISIELIRLNGNQNAQWENPKHPLHWGPKPPITTSHKPASTQLSLSLNDRIALTELNGDAFNVQFANSIFTCKELEQLEYHVNSALASQEWRKGAKIISEHLSKKLPQEFIESLSRLQLTKSHPRHSWVRFVAPRGYLRAPFEFLRTERDYLVLEYPMFRAISNNFCTKKGLSPSLTKDPTNPLRVLLIAADPRGNILQDIEHEIKTIFDLFERSIVSSNRDIDVIWPDQANFKAVQDVLRNTSYHILHFAGHSTWNHQNPERSGVLLNDVNGKEIILPAYQLAAWVKNSSLRFCFLSSCEGARNSEDYNLLKYDFLGLSDALVRANVPEVIGFRWAISSKKALSFAKEFYNALLFKYFLCTEKAMFEARSRIAEIDRNDSTWIAPILISQK